VVVRVNRLLAASAMEHVVVPDPAGNVAIAPGKAIARFFDERDPAIVVPDWLAADAASLIACVRHGGKG
jgi:hypothetical protein